MSSVVGSLPVPPPVAVPAGRLVMGSNHHYPEEAPEREVDVAAFRLRMGSVAAHDAVDSTTGGNNGGGGVGGPALASVAPGSGARGTSVRVTFTLGGQAPPANVQPTSASLGTLVGTAIARNGTQVSATFNIPANASPGPVNAAVVFPGPPGMGNVTFSLADGFTIQ